MFCLTDITDKNQLPLTRIQKLIGCYMQQSKRRKACAYIRVRIDLTELVSMRRVYGRKIKTPLTTNDFFMYAIAQAVKAYPLMAGTIDATGHHIVIAESIGIGFAVAAPQGLVVPVIKQMNDKTLTQTAAESKVLLDRARSNKLLPDDFDGANIVLTGLGMYGIESFYAISPPSATGILSIGNIEEAVVPLEGEFQIRKMMYAALAFDQRVVDEFYAAKFLKMIRELLENPTNLTSEAKK